MQLKKSLGKLEQYLISKSEFNTNNAWGFGGGKGTSYILQNGVEIRIGKAYYRHAPPERYVTAQKDGKRFLDGTSLSVKYISAIEDVATGKKVVCDTYAGGVYGLIDSNIKQR